MGKSYFVGNNKDDCVKLDLFYTDRFIREILLIDDIRLATVEEIIAMKIDVISWFKLSPKLNLICVQEKINSEVAC